MRHVTTALVAILVPLAAASAQGIVAQSSGLPSPGRTVDFGANLFPNGTPVTTQFAGLTITHAAYATTSANNNVVGGFLTNDVSAAPPDTLSIRFAHAITDVSFVYHQIGTSSPTTVRAVLQGVTVDSFAILWNQTQPNNFFGFTETALDELQIDFDGDFRLDELAFDPLGGAACHPFNGNNVNPASFGCVTLPALGTTWQATVFATPNTLSTALVWAPAGLGPPVPLLGGELLLNPSLAMVAFSSPTTYSLAVPPQPTWVGTRLAFQGVRLELVGGSPTLVPLNAMLLIVGL